MDKDSFGVKDESAFVERAFHEPFTSYFNFNNPYLDTNNQSSFSSFQPSNDLFPDATFSSSDSDFLFKDIPTNNNTTTQTQDSEITILDQPPVEVRTRTPHEKRTFAAAVQVEESRLAGCTHVSVDLAYANPNDGKPNQDILGGTKMVKIGSQGIAHFNDLSMCEASTKHKGSEFCLQFFLSSSDRTPVSHFSTSSRPFYAYSNQKVLTRRRNVELRALSKNRVDSRGGEPMHVIGAPFILSASLQVKIHTAHGDVLATNLELYSESVLFFNIPAYPLQDSLPDGMEFRAQLRVSNDGRHFSNPMEIIYTVENTPKRLRSRF